MAKRKLVQFNLNRIREKGELNFLILDLFMTLVVIINLLWLIFDWHFHFGFVQRFFEQYFNDFYTYYKYRIHPDFLLYDVYFVSIFITELVVRWIIAIRNKTYHSWFWYPFVHWYDVLGCIPLGTFRFLRLFRVLSIMIRLHKLEIINLKKSYPYALFKKYYNILVEEVSDRVVVNVLESWQESIKEGGPVMDRIKTEVLLPKKDVLVDWASERLIKATEENYTAKKEEIKENLSNLVLDALEKNEDIKSIKRIPLVGKSIVEQLETSITRATLGMLDGLMEEIGTENNKVLLDNAADLLFKGMEKREIDTVLDKIAKEIAVESIEIVKDDVKVQKWKEAEAKRKQVKERAKAIKQASEMNKDSQTNFENQPPGSGLDEGAF